MARTTKKKKKQQKGIDINIAVVLMIIVSILLGVLIYSKSGYIGQTLSPILGGIMGPIKYIIPVGMFIIAIYITYQDREYLFSKLIQFGIFLLCIATILSVSQISKGNINIQSEVTQMARDGYYLGEKDIGGGLIGAIIAGPLIKLLGEFGTIIVCVGTAVLLLVFMFGIRPAEMISAFMETQHENREERKNERREARINKRNEIEVEDKTRPVKETKRERRLREQEEKRRQAEQLPEQITINMNDEPRDSKKKLKSYNHDEDDLIPFNIKKGRNKQDANPDVIDANLFKTEQETKEEKVKEVLQLEHTMTVEDENYEFPPIQLLSEADKKPTKASKKAVTDVATRLQKTLYSFGVSAKVENVSVGPAITRYELRPAEGVRVSKIANLADDIALSLAAETIRIEAPIPGKQAVGIEVPNAENEVVHFREIVDTDTFRNHKSKLAFAVGKDVGGQEVVADISKMPHVMIAGATGSGKSVCINTLIGSIIYKAKPNEVKMVMIDPKVVELSVYNGIPHLLIPVVTDPKKAAGALAWAVQEMENRYAMFASKGVRDLKGYNESVENEEGAGKLPHIVIIIDELADLMMVAKNDVEDAICRLAQKARAAGMHLVIATQRPSVDVITGLIKANIPSRIAFAVSSQVDSRTILDMAGAEKLLGKGDMLFYPAGAPKPTRIQGAFISDKEVEKIVDFIKDNSSATYNDDIIKQIENAGSTDKELAQQQQEDDDNTDPFLMDAIDVVVETGQASTSFIQRRFKVGYARAGRIIDQMEERGVISGFQGSKPREVLMSKERWEELKMSTDTSEIDGNE